MKADEREARRIVRERAGADEHTGFRGYCEAGIIDLCAGHGSQWHHRLNRSQGGKWAASNGMWVCAYCHTWITEHPREAVEKGWAVRSSMDPAEAPALLDFHRRPQMLGEDGSIRDATDAELIAFGVPAQFGYPVGGEVA